MDFNQRSVYGKLHTRERLERLRLWLISGYRIGFSGHYLFYEDQRTAWTPVIWMTIIFESYGMYNIHMIYVVTPSALWLEYCTHWLLCEYIHMYDSKHGLVVVLLNNLDLALSVISRRNHCQWQGPMKSTGLLDQKKRGTKRATRRTLISCLSFNAVEPIPLSFVLNLCITALAPFFDGDLH